MREQYKAQKDEEETKRQFFLAPGALYDDNVNGVDSNEEDDQQFTNSVDHMSELTPEPSPSAFLHSSSSQGSPQPSPHQTPPAPRSTAAPPVISEPPRRENNYPPEVAPRPKPAASQFKPSGGSNVEGYQYNPYPSPAMSAPPLPREPERAPVNATVVAPPTVPRVSQGVDKEELFVYPWYHGSIPRDEALRRLESVGGFDG